MDENHEKTLSHLDPQKRETLRKLVLGTAFAIPVIASFSMNEVSVLKASGYGGDGDRHGGHGSGNSGGNGSGRGISGK